jgi:hypothetical protein
MDRMLHELRDLFVKRGEEENRTPPELELRLF